MKRLVLIIRSIFLLSGCGLCIYGSFLLRDENYKGKKYLAAAALMLLPSQIDVLRRHSNDPEDQAVPRWFVISGLSIATLFCAYSCFTYLSTSKGFHYDIAEFGLPVLDQMRIIQRGETDLPYQIFSKPHVMLAGWLATRWGWGLFQVRILGAIYCFLLLPAVYLLVREYFNRAGAVFAALMFSGSLWNFTLSKVATWDTAVPILAVLTIYFTVVIFERKHGLWAAPLLLITIVLGWNVYEAYRLIFPVLAGVAWFHTLFRWRKIPHFLVVSAVVGITIAFQAYYVDSHFWERITGSQLVKTFPPPDMRFFAWNFFGKMFFSTYDIYLSQSQGGIDHPIAIGLLIAGVIITVANFSHPFARDTLLWLGLAVIASLFFEGQWRRGSIAFPLLSIYAILPFMMWRTYWRYLIPKWLKLRTALTLVIPAIGVMVFVVFNISRFEAIHYGRWGGYYESQQEIAAIKFATTYCQSGAFPLYLVSDTHQPLWDFFVKLSGVDKPCFGPDQYLVPFGEHLEQALTTLRTAYSSPGEMMGFFVRNSPPALPLMKLISDLRHNSPSQIEIVLIPEGTPEFIFCIVSGEASNEHVKNL